MIFELLSPSDSGTDFCLKNEEYAATPSVRRYVILAQDAIRGTVSKCQAEDWVEHILSADSILAIPEIGIEVPPADFYRGVDLSGAAVEEGAPT